MPVPKRKRSRARRDSRFANKGLKVAAFGLCSGTLENKPCAAPLLPHIACKKCGYYKGAKLFATKGDRSAKRHVERATKTKKENTNTPDQAAE